MNRLDLGRRIDRIRSDIRVLEEAIMGTDEPTRPPVEPEPPPVETRPEWPAVKVTISPERGEPVTAKFDAPPRGVWTPEDGWFWAYAHTILAGADVHVWWEDTPAGKWPTVWVQNGQARAGTLKFKTVAISIGPETWDWTGAEATILPSQAMPMCSTRLPIAAHWKWCDPSADFPAWSENKAAVEIETRKDYRISGRPFWWADHSPSGPVPADPGAPAGFGVGWYHGGPQDWLAGPTGKACRYAEMVAESWKALYRLDAQGAPQSVAAPYWSGRDYDVNRIPGYEWDSTRATDLHQHGRPADGPHFRRWYGAAAAIAKWSAPARFVCKAAWADVRSAWNLDGYQNQNDLLRGFQYLLNGTWGKDPATTGLRGSRYLAHAVLCLADCWEWIEREERERYAIAFCQFFDQLGDENGVVNRDTSGDTGQYVGQLKPPLCSMFHQALIVGAYQRLNEVAGFIPAKLPKAEAWMSPAPWAYAVETLGAYPARSTWKDRKYAGTSPDAGTYATRVLGTWVAWVNAQAMDTKAQGMGINGDAPYDLVPPALRPA